MFNYKILPTELVNLAALALPWVELLAGSLLIAGRLTFPTAFILTGLVLVFIAAIGYNLARGPGFPMRMLQHLAGSATCRLHHIVSGHSVADSGGPQPGGPRPATSGAAPPVREGFVGFLDFDDIFSRPVP